MSRAKGNKRTPHSSTPPKEGCPQSFGESFAGEIFTEAIDANTIKASIDYPVRTQQNPLLNQTRTIMYQQIDKGIMPFNLQGNATFIDIQNLVELCQKAYFNVSVFRNTIDTMTEFSNSELFFKGGNEKTRKFFHNWFYHKIGGHSFADKFFREWFRSGNVIMHRFDGDIVADILKQIRTIYGAENKLAENIKIPVRYAILNPAYLRSEYGMNMSTAAKSFYLVLTYYECQRIRNPVTEEDKDLRNALSKEQLRQINQGAQALFPLNPLTTHTVFCKKQDYEPFAVPMFFPVLSDIDLKLTFKGVEKILARTVEYVILLIKVGTEENPNPVALQAMQELMINETLGRVLVADGTTNMDFVIPDLNKVLGPEKYKQVNEDIANGLMNIFASDEKFSSTSIKIKVFMERLNESRYAFLDFINSEIKRISSTLGFKSFPHAEMASVDINDSNLFQKVIVQLGQLGILTGPQVIEAIKTNYLPTPDESVDGQKEFKEFKDAGLFQPLLGVKQDAGGRPDGSKGSPQQTQNTSPVGTSKASYLEVFDVAQLAETLKSTNFLYAQIEGAIKKKFKIKELKAEQKNILNDILTLIVINEPQDKWSDVVAGYIEKPKMIEASAGLEVDKISDHYKTSTFLSAVLRHCKKEKEMIQE